MDIWLAQNLFTINMFMSRFWLKTKTLGGTLPKTVLNIVFVVLRLLGFMSLLRLECDNWKVLPQGKADHWTHGCLSGQIADFLQIETPEDNLLVRWSSTPKISSDENGGC